MIARIEGKLLSLDNDLALVEVGQVCYEVMLPNYCAVALSDKVGSEVALCTLEYYEGTLGGGNLIPRMVGFLSAAERTFFTRFTSVKGLGIKKGLKALSIPIAEIASAIENSNEKVLCTLPAIGKRMAQQIVAELKGKLIDFAVDVERPKSLRPHMRQHEVEALEILIAWGEKRTEAMDLIEMVQQRHPEITTAEALVPLVYRLKQGIEV